MFEREKIQKDVKRNVVILKRNPIEMQYRLDGKKSIKSKWEEKELIRLLWDKITFYIELIFVPWEW